MIGSLTIIMQQEQEQQEQEEQLQKASSLRQTSSSSEQGEGGGDVSWSFRPPLAAGAAAGAAAAVRKGAATTAPVLSSLSSQQPQPQPQPQPSPAAALSASTPTTTTTTTTTTGKRYYRTTGGTASTTTTTTAGGGDNTGGSGANKWVTRDIAALDFLLGIPLEAEAQIVHRGWLLQQKQHWDKQQHYDHTDNNENDDDDDDDENDNHPHHVPVRKYRGDALEPPYEALRMDQHQHHYYYSSSLSSSLPYHHHHHHHHHHRASNSSSSSAHAAARGRWWEQLVKPHLTHAAAAAGDLVSSNNSSSTSHARTATNPTFTTDQLEGPTTEDKGLTVIQGGDTGPTTTTTTTTASSSSNRKNAVVTAAAAAVSVYAPPGRRLEGDKAVYIQIPLTTKSMTKQKSIARSAALREWERQTAHGRILAATTTMTTTTSTTTTTTTSTSTTSNTKNHNHAVGSGGGGGGGGGAPLKAGPQYQPPLLDGRIYFSASGSYPMAVYSIIRYEPRKEEAIQRRQKLEAMGGGGSQFIISPARRDWRGISYRALLPRTDEKEYKAFNRFLHKNKGKMRMGATTTTTTGGGSLVPQSSHMATMDTAVGNGVDDDDDDDDDNDSVSSESTDDSDVYVPGLLDDPKMVLGRHRYVMIGDRVTGPIVSSTIQFVDPAILKADLNKQFRERFDGWEPPKSARKYIGARVLHGNYVLMDPAENPVDYYDGEDDNKSSENSHVNYHMKRPRQGSVTSMNSQTASESGNTAPKEKLIRMPPSLTLSKIRSLKHQALHAAVAAQLEIATLALACVYFERLCLDCRVDKSNRRLAFASCLLLATKLNEPNVGLVMNHEHDDGMARRIHSLIRPNRRSTTMFASLLEFFTQEWNLTLKNLFEAEWGVFVALGFSLHATPSQVAFHFKRFCKTLGWNHRAYLGDQMYNCWQDALMDEEHRRQERERKRELRRQRKEEQLLNFHIEMEQELRRKAKEKDESTNKNSPAIADEVAFKQRQKLLTTRPVDARLQLQQQLSPQRGRKSVGINIFQRLGMRRAVSQERLNHLSQSERPTNNVTRRTHGSFTGDSGGGDGDLGLSSSDAGGLKQSPSMPALSTALSPLTSTITCANEVAAPVADNVGQSASGAEAQVAKSSMGIPDTGLHSEVSTFSIDIPDAGLHSDTSTIGSFEASEKDGLVV